MWKIKTKEIKKGINQYQILEKDQPISFEDWINHLKNSAAFAEFFIEVLRTSDFEAYFWEVKPVSQSTLKNPFEFVLVESSILTQITADETSFKEHFAKGTDVIAFPNLGGDAQLIVPNKMAEASNYSHLAKFIRNAPKDQVISFWKRVGVEYEKGIGEKTKWLSTAGLGVYWLHVRIDSRPKYYRYVGYKTVK